jgi:hypothetical protein
MKRSLGGMSPSSGHNVGFKLLSFHAEGNVPTTHGYYLKTFGHYIGKKLSLVFVLSCARKYMRRDYRAQYFFFLMLINT